MIQEIIQGDCLEVMKELPDGCIDLILTDLPYGTTRCKWDSIIDLAQMWEQVKRVLKPSGAFVTTAAQPFTSALVMSNPKWLKQELIWRKSRATGHLDAKRKHLKAHESILVFGVGNTVYNPQMVQGKPHIRGPWGKHSKQHSEVYSSYVDNNSRAYESDLYYPQSIINVDVETRTIHPTQKPVALFEYLIKTYSNEGDLVLDCTAGSGTTGVAAVNTGRNFILIEKEPEYVAIAEKRIAEALQTKEAA